MPAVPASSPVVSSKHNDSIRDPPCPHPLLPTGKRIFLFSIASLLPDIIHEFALLWKTLVRVRNPRNESSDEERSLSRNSRFGEDPSIDEIIFMSLSAPSPPSRIHGNFRRNSIRIFHGWLSLHRSERQIENAALLRT